MPIRATGPQGAATRPAWKVSPIPDGLTEGPVDAATFAVLRHCEALPGDVDAVLAPSLGIGAHAGRRPIGPERLHATTGLSVDRTRWLLQEAALLGRYLGPPESLTAAIGLIEDLGVIGLPALVASWLEHGLTGAALHPWTVAKIAGLFGLSAPFTIVRGERGQWRTPLVVADRLGATVSDAAITVRRKLRANRLLTVAEAAKLTEGLTASETRRLCEACWWLIPDGGSVVDWRPYGIDNGVGRTILAAGRPVAAGVVHAGLRRWARDSSDRHYDWTVRQLNRYLAASPLYQSHEAGTFGVLGDWAALTEGDQHLLAALDAVGEPAGRPHLVAALVSAGHGDGAAKHLIAVSPAVAPAGRGIYRRPQ